MPDSRVQELKNKALQEANLRRLSLKINKHRQRIDARSLEYSRLLQKLENYIQKQLALIDRNPEAAGVTGLEKVRYFFVLLIPFCAYFFNVLLIYRPSEFLVQQGIGINAATPRVILSVPIAIALFELGLAILIAMIIDEDKNDFLKYLPSLIVWFTPILLLSAQVAQFQAEGRLPDLFEILLITALFLLALVTDYALVRATPIIIKAFAYIIYGYRLGRFEAKIARLERRAQKQFFQAGITFDQYELIIQQHNESSPERPFKNLPFNRTSQEVIQRWLREKQPL